MKRRSREHDHPNELETAARSQNLDLMNFILESWTEEETQNFLTQQLLQDNYNSIFRDPQIMGDIKILSFFFELYKTHNVYINYENFPVLFLYLAAYGTIETIEFTLEYFNFSNENLKQFLETFIHNNGTIFDMFAQRYTFSSRPFHLKFLNYILDLCTTSKVNIQRLLLNTTQHGTILHDLSGPFSFDVEIFKTLIAIFKTPEEKNNFVLIHNGDGLTALRVLRQYKNLNLISNMNIAKLLESFE